jgi:hypothetical protein
VVDFVEVVILCCEPKDGDVRVAGPSRVAGAGNGSGGLEWREEGTTEEANLLAGNDDAGAGA